jgi:hypothetical protein
VFGLSSRGLAPCEWHEKKDDGDDEEEAADAGDDDDYNVVFVW